MENARGASAYEKAKCVHPNAGCKIRDLGGYSSDPLLSHYGGTAGRKLCYVINGVPWMVKFPRKPGSSPVSFDTGPVAEYIGSRIYGSLGIDVQDVGLGAIDAVGRDGRPATKIVAMCRDFASESPVVGYGDVKSSLSGELFPGSSNGSDPRGEPLSDALAAIESAELFQMAGAEAVLARFWDMFVADAFIGNPGRGNGDWGLQVSRRGDVSIAPVYDNGDCLFARQGGRGLPLAKAAGSLDAFVSGTLSFFTGPDGRRIRSFDLIASGCHPGLTDALFRFMERADMGEVRDIVRGVPESHGDSPVLPEEMAELVVGSLECAHANKLEPAWRALKAPSVPAG